MVDSVLELDSERKLLVPDQQAKSIVLKDVRFSFPESPILQLKISDLKLKAGDRVMLVDSIGSYKSTLLKMLAGQYKPTEGRVKLGDAGLRETDPNVVNDQLGYLPQNVHFFKGTLRSNPALSGAVSDSSILRVSEEIGIDKIAASNPRGLDLNISEGGNCVSGGAKAKVVYVSPDTLKEHTAQGEEIYYRVHLVSSTTPVFTTTGKELEILPGMTA